MVAQKAWKLDYLWHEFELIEAKTMSIWDDESWETDIIIAKQNFTSRKTDLLEKKSKSEKRLKRMQASIGSANQGSSNLNETHQIGRPHWLK